MNLLVIITACLSVPLLTSTAIKLSRLAAHSLLQPALPLPQVPQQR